MLEYCRNEVVIWLDVEHWVNFKSESFTLNIILNL